METAILRGREHTRLASIAAIADGRCAIALSRGGARKTYRHCDPNEDAAGFFEGDAGCLVAVADAHDGCEASETAIDHLLERYGPQLTGVEPAGIGADWTENGATLLAEVDAAIARRRAAAGGRRSVTTLAFALVRPADDLLAFGAVGDSHVFRVSAGDGEDIALAAGAFTAFLGEPTVAPDETRRKGVFGTRSLAQVRAVVLATDGISERGIGLAAPSRAVLDAATVAADCEPSLRPLVAARTLVERANEAQRANHAGDNVAAAVVWVAP